MKYCILLLLLLPFSSIGSATKNAQDVKSKNKVLFVTTNIDRMNNSPNGTYLIELAIPFSVFTQKGYEVDIISPNGGPIPMYHSGDTTEIVKSIIKTDHYQQKVTNSLAPNEINPAEYLAVIIPGGYGQFWDTHQNKAILQIIAEIYDSGGAVGTVGHGTATLIDVRLKSGEFLVKDKTMTSFPSWNEKNRMKQSNYGELLPYDMEVELLKRGANLKVYNHDAGINYELVDPDNRLVTASFASGGKFIAEEVLKLIESPNETSLVTKFTTTLHNPKLVKLWETEAVLSDIESAIYDEENRLIYTSNISGNWLKPNGKGFLSQVNLRGEIIKLHWIDGLDGPTGSALFNNKLYVADFDAIYEYDITNSDLIKKHLIQGTERINDLTIDEAGIIYGSGTKSGKLFSLKDGKTKVLKNELEWPNGLLYEEGNILIGLGDGSISSFNLRDKTSNIIATEISNPDGIVSIGNGDYIISSWEGLIHYVTRDGEKTLLLDTVKEGVNAADLCYIQSKRMLLVPAMLKNKLVAYELVERL